MPEDANSKFPHYSLQTKCREPKGAAGVFSGSPASVLQLKRRKDVCYEEIAGLGAIPVALLLV